VRMWPGGCAVSQLHDSVFIYHRHGPPAPGVIKGKRSLVIIKGQTSGPGSLSLLVLHFALVVILRQSDILVKVVIPSIKQEWLTLTEPSFLERSDKK
jgi:hypothetical protein